MILKNKKLQEDKSAMEMSMSVVVVAIIALLILVVLIFIMGGKVNIFNQGSDCAAQQGYCTTEQCSQAGKYLGNDICPKKGGKTQNCCSLT